MKKSLLMILTFLFCLVGPNLLFPFFRTEEDEGTGENRALAEFPVLTADTADTFPADAEQYLNDHAAFRNRFLSLSAALNLELFSYADSLQVITGKDGWYFYTADDTAEDLLGINRFPEETLSSLIRQTKEIQKALSDVGTEFIILIAPNKESIYTEYLPDGFERPGTLTRREELIAALQSKTSVPVIDPYPLLKEDRSRPWYFKTDTHWNDAAGFLTGQLIIDAAGGTPVSVDSVTIDYVPRKAGDLAALFHMPESYNDDTAAVVSGWHDDLTVQFDDPDGSGNLVRLTTPGAPDPRRIAIYRDSFGVALLPALPKYFEHTDFCHWQVFEPSFLTEEKPDILVYEVVERSLGRMESDLARILDAALLMKEP